MELTRGDLAAWSSALASLEGDGRREQYRHDIAGWAWDRLGVMLWSKQAEIAESVVRRRRTSVQSAAGVGKSFLAAIIALWWIDTHPPGEALVVTTAPTGEQVGAILWEEIRKHHQASWADGKVGIPGTVQRGLPVHWVLDNGRKVGIGRKPADHVKSAFQGLHRRYVLVILDEAGGCPVNLWTGAEAITTNLDCRVLAIGNPDDSSSHFAKVCLTSNKWHTIKVSAFDSPNFTGEACSDDMRAVLPDPQQVEDLRSEWGETNPLWIAKVLGDFADAQDGLIPLSWIVAAQSRWREWRADYDGSQQPPGRTIFGVDVARFGEDKTAIATRKGHVVAKVERFAKYDTVETTNLVTARMDCAVQSLAVPDADGIGGAVVDLLRARGYPVRAYSGASATKLRDRTGLHRFANTRSAAWYNMREMLDPSFDSVICLPDDDHLAADLAAPKWPDTTNGVITVEKKVDIVKRLGRSPDTGDACLVAGTLVTTVGGLVPIEAVRPGDMVWTRAGWRAVEIAGLTAESAPLITVTLVNGESLTGTGNHPVWDGNSFRRLDSFTFGDKMTMCQVLNESNTVVSSSPDTRTRPVAITAFITGRLKEIVRTVSALSTLRCGRRNGDPSLMGGMSIMSMTTRWITGLRTLSVSPRRSMPSTTLLTAGVGKMLSIWRGCGSWLRRGTGPMRAAHGTANMGEAVGQIEYQSMWASVLAVDSRFKALSQSRVAEPTDGVVATVSRRRPTVSVSTTMTRTVRSVGRRFSSSWDTTHLGQKLALVPVVHICVAGVGPVYNLQVQGQPEYLANGILVHNCVQVLWVDRMPRELDSTTPSELLAPIEYADAVGWS